MNKQIVQRWLETAPTEDVKTILSKLPPILNRFLTLRYVDKLTWEDISDKTTTCDMRLKQHHNYALEIIVMENWLNA